MNTERLALFFFATALSVYGQSGERFPFLTTIERNGTAICSGIAIDERRILSAKLCFLDDLNKYSIVGRNKNDEPSLKWRGWPLMTEQFEKFDPLNLTFVIVHLKPPGMDLAVGVPKSAPLIDKVEHDITNAYIVRTDLTTHSVDILSSDNCTKLVGSALSIPADIKSFPMQRVLCGIVAEKSSKKANICEELPGAPLIRDGYVIAILTTTFCSSNLQLAVFMQIERKNVDLHSTIKPLIIDDDQINSVVNEDRSVESRTSMSSSPYKDSSWQVADSFQWFRTKQMEQGRVKRQDNATAEPGLGSGDEGSGSMTGSGEWGSGSGEPRTPEPPFSEYTPVDGIREDRTEGVTEAETIPDEGDTEDYDNNDNRFESGSQGGSMKSKGKGGATATFPQNQATVLILLSLFSLLSISPFVSL